MVFVVVIMAAMTTIIASSLDLSAVVEQRQHQMEREAAWHYVEDCAIARVQDLVNESNSWTNDFVLVLNGISARVTSRPSTSWQVGKGIDIRVSGTLDGRTRTVNFRRSGREEPNVFQLGFGVLQDLSLTANIEVTGDAYLGGDLESDSSSFRATGDLFIADNEVSDLLEGVGRNIYLNQRDFRINFNLEGYQKTASRILRGNVTLDKPLFLNSLTRSELIYVEGNLTLSGSYVGNATIVVNGNCFLENPRSTTVLDHVVLLVNGNVFLSGGRHDAFIACNGVVTNSTADGSLRRIFGSLITSKLEIGKSNYQIEYENIFEIRPDLKNAFHLPSQW